MSRLHAADEVACSRTVLAFYTALDASDAAACAGLMAAEVVWERADGVLHGRAAVRAAVAARDPARITLHQVVNLLLCAAGPEVVAAEYALVVHSGPASPSGPAELQATTVLRGGDRLVREGGAWRVAWKRFTPLLRTR